MLYPSGYNWYNPSGSLYPMVDPKGIPSAAICRDCRGSAPHAPAAASAAMSSAQLPPSASRCVLPRWRPRSVRLGLAMKNVGNVGFRGTANSWEPKMAVMSCIEPDWTLPSLVIQVKYIYRNITAMQASRTIKRHFPYQHGHKLGYTPFPDTPESH